MKGHANRHSKKPAGAPPCDSTRLARQMSAWRTGRPVTGQDPGARTGEEQDQHRDGEDDEAPHLPRRPRDGPPERR